MNPKMSSRMLTDFAMTVLLLCQMAYMLVGESAHEWMGAAMFVIFLIHHVLNWRWYRNLIRGRYTLLRILQTVVNSIVFLCMLGLMVSGIMMSRYVFSFLDLSGNMGFARTLHMLSAYWGFLFMSVHIGLHWNMIMNMAGKMAGVTAGKGTAGKRTVGKEAGWALRILAWGAALYGIYAFIKHDIASYLFLRNMFVFVFFDVSQPLGQFIAEYAAMMVLWAGIAYYMAKGLQKIKR